MTAPERPICPLLSSKVIVPPLALVHRSLLTCRYVEMCLLMFVCLSLICIPWDQDWCITSISCQHSAQNTVGADYV